MKYKVFGLANDALEAMTNEQPTLIFTDLNMPGMSGLEMTRDIRQKYTSAELPIVLVTAPEEVSTDDEVMDIGIDRVIPKPFNMELVGDALQEFGLIEEEVS
jgi:CheY-like chemotaxis protein